MEGLGYFCTFMYFIEEDTVCTWESEDNLRHHVDPRCRTQVFRLAGKCPYPLSISLALRNSQTPVTRLYPEPNTTKQLGSEAKTPASPLLSRQFQCAAGWHRQFHFWFISMSCCRNPSQPLACGWQCFPFFSADMSGFFILLYWDQFTFVCNARKTLPTVSIRK